MKKKIFLVLPICLALVSCTTVASMFAEDIMATELNKVKPTNGAQPSLKAQEKEAEKLKKEGKCPVCHGMGKTPDGHYDCASCNGTGKYQENSK